MVFETTSNQVLNARSEIDLYDTRRVALTAKNLKKTFTSGKRTTNVLSGIDFSVRQGEFLAITGNSGSGKSTLLQLLGGLDRPTSGEVAVDGRSLGDMNDRELSEFRNKKLGFVFQFFYLQPFLSVKDNIKVAGMPSKLNKKYSNERALSLVKAVGMEDEADYYPNQLSGGQMQRVAIARALFNNPSIILADEPTGNLDEFNSRKIIEMLKAECMSLKASLVVVTHDLQVAALADRQINMRDGINT